ncbi:molybdopterin-binding protein [Desulfovibrio sp. OttesenSCG-928-C06]|nr:molybdopterin-binding protein [Desulfovibrio sp. OttesenSCG-928-C06]
MKIVPVEESVGCIIGHDITEISGGARGKGFKRGHIVRPEDVKHLLRLGKRNICVWDDENGDQVHEDDAARRMAAAIAGTGTTHGEPREGRIDLRAAHQGLFSVNLELLTRLNSIPYVTIATRHTLQEVQPEDSLIGVRVTPLAVPESTVDAVESCCRESGPLAKVIPFRKLKVAIVTTGSEVASGLVKDEFGPVLKAKFAAWGSEVISQVVVTDETAITTEAIKNALASGAEMIAVTGGMSVDPDDKTPAAIRAVGCDIVTYGAPVFPGAMFMLGYMGNIPVMGLPGCVMYRRATILDFIVPRILAGHRITRHDITNLAHGGLCDSCKVCTYPQCSFGKF